MFFMYQKNFFEYLNSFSSDKIDIEVDFSFDDWSVPSALSEFEDLIYAIFNNFNVKILTLNNVENHLMTSDLYQKIKNCHSDMWSLTD